MLTLEALHQRFTRPDGTLLSRALLKPAEAAVWLGYVKADGSPNLNSLYLARSRWRLRASKVGGALRFRIRDLEAFAAEEDRVCR